jgi:polyhydroxyalkanoate synthesis regulator phasin
MYQSTSVHSFHIPVMGLGYTADSPIKVAQFGISSVISIMDDHLMEDLRRIYSEKYDLPFQEISEKEEDFRAKRITAYLDLVQQIVDLQIEEIRENGLTKPELIEKYAELLSDEHPNKFIFDQFLKASPAQQKSHYPQIQSLIIPGAIDVNIMTKVDKMNYDKDGTILPREYSDALASLRGFAKSKIKGSVVFSAGLNPALYSYAENFDCFFPNSKGKMEKGIILKVSDYRSALIQGKFLAKKGLWVSEFRIESGLNCGGHAFATDGFLIGPILEEFKTNKTVLKESLFEVYQKALADKGVEVLSSDSQIKITYQGGIGNAQEDSFLRNYYALDGTGWGSPFLLVPEATSVDDDTLQRILKSKKSDYFLSHASPLGVPFNNLRNSSGEEQRIRRLENNRPGSPCYKKFLSFSTEFTDKPICTASRQYQNLKSKQFQNGEITESQWKEVAEKDCLCEGLSAPAILANGSSPRRNLNAVTICPGPNLAYFKGVFSLKEMVSHIYGKLNLNLDLDRPHVFVKEAQLYVSHLKNEFQKLISNPSTKQENYLGKFKTNLEQGIAYYQELIKSAQIDSEEILEKMKAQLDSLLAELNVSNNLVSDQQL